MKKIIPIVFASDDGYAMPTAVAITSALRNKNRDTFYKIYIATPSLSPHHQAKLESLANDECSIEIISNKALLEGKSATLEKVTSTDYYRLMLDTILPHEDKVLALDGDILVFEDLWELYETPLEQNYLAGCYFRPHDVYNRAYVQEVLKLDEGERINIGVMVVNLAALREDKIQEKFVSYIGAFKTMSEDIINYVCKGRIAYLPIKYNYNLHCYRFEELLAGDPHYSLDAYAKARENPSIFHFTTGRKPWKRSDVPNWELWRDYFLLSPYKEYYLRKIVDASTERYILSKMLNAKVYPNRQAMFEDALAQMFAEGLVLEFGVYSAKTINMLSSLMPHRVVYGFDSFEGLPEDWRPGYVKGTFATGGIIPQVNENVSLIKGYFDVTLPEFIKEHKEKAALIHVDCDLYSSTKTVFELLGDRIVVGTILIFDEYFNYPTWQEHEYKAFQEFVQQKGLSYMYMGYIATHQQVAVKIIEPFA